MVLPIERVLVFNIMSSSTPPKQYKCSPVSQASSCLKEKLKTPKTRSPLKSTKLTENQTVDTSPFEQTLKIGQKKNKKTDSYLFGNSKDSITDFLKIANDLNEGIRIQYKLAKRDNIDMRPVRMFDNGNESDY